MKDRVDVTIPMERDLRDRVDAQLGYGDSRAEWVRETLRARLDALEDEEKADTTAGGVDVEA